METWLDALIFMYPSMFYVAVPHSPCPRKVGRSKSEAWQLREWVSRLWWQGPRTPLPPPPCSPVLVPTPSWFPDEGPGAQSHGEHGYKALPHALILATCGPQF